MKSIILSSLAALFIIAGSASAKDLLVPSEYKTIQAAIDDANDGDIVIVADGTYTGQGNRDIDFKGKAIILYSENGPENCIIDCQGSKGELHRGFYFHSGEDANSIVDGFTVTNGYAGYGGGLYCCGQSSPIIANCIVTNNSAGKGGGIVSDANSSPTIVTCEINGNFASNCGGGLYCKTNSSPTISHCLIIGNSTAADGGGIRCSDSSPIIENCVISCNAASYHAGGFYGSHGSPTISNCVISGNSANGTFCNGGGLYFYYCAATISNCIISGNSAKKNGGALLCWSSPVTVINCTIADNLASGGPAIYCRGFNYPRGSKTLANLSPTIVNCIVQGNRHDAFGSDQQLPAIPVLLTYSNVQGDWPGEGNVDAEPLFIMDGPDAITGTWTEPLSYDPNTNRTVLADANASFIPDELVGWLIQISSAHGKQALITANTAIAVEVVGDLRADVTKGDNYRLVDYYLQPGSPCIDAGTAEGTPATDIQGRTRDGKPDIGAYETGF